MTKNLNLLKEFIKNQEKQFTKEIVNDTLNYQKKYGFKIGENNVATDGKWVTINGNHVLIKD